MKKLLYFIVFAAAIVSWRTPIGYAVAGRPATDVQQALLSGGTTGLTREQRISDAKMVIGILETGYAPLEWKEEFFGMSFEEHSRSFLDKVSGDLTDVEFYSEIAKYLSSFHDSHVGFSLPSTHISSLPFGVDNIDGHIIVTKVSDPIGDKSDVQIAVGDELLKVDGRDIKSVLDDLKTMNGEGNSASEDRYAAYFLTYRPQKRFPEVLTGKTILELRSHNDNSIKKVVLEWQSKGYELAPFNTPGIQLGKALVRDPDRYPHNILEELRWNEPFLDLKGETWNAGEPWSFFPLGDSFVARKNEPYPTGVIILDGLRIGYLRLHHYSTNTIDEKSALAELEEETTYLEENTDALIIDQTGNTGGDLCFTLKIASFFFDEPQNEIPLRMRANRENLLAFEALSMNSSLNENDKIIVDSIIKDFRHSMENGIRLSQPHAVCNNDGLVRPYTNENGDLIVYTKPVLILVDELAVSAGDFFPVLMQDTGRAVIFGTQTAGGGGAVKRIKTRIGYSEIMLFYTFSLGVREEEVTTSNGIRTHYVENVGAIPDIPYHKTLKDHYSGYKMYQEAVFNAVKGLLSP